MYVCMCVFLDVCAQEEIDDLSVESGVYSSGSIREEKLLEMKHLQADGMPTCRRLILFPVTKFWFQKLGVFVHNLSFYSCFLEICGNEACGKLGTIQTVC